MHIRIGSHLSLVFGLLACTPAVPVIQTASATPASGPVDPVVALAEQTSIVKLPGNIPSPYPVISAQPDRRMVQLGAVQVSRQSSVDVPLERPPIAVELGVDFSALYPRHVDLGLIELRGEDLRLVFHFRSDRPLFRGVAYGIVDGAGELSERGIADDRVSIDLSAEPSNRNFVIWFQAVDEDGVRSAPLSIGVTFTPPEDYAAAGWSSPGAVAIDWSEIPWAVSRVEDWVLDRASDADKAFADATWGELVRAQNTTEAKVRALSVALLEQLNPHGGVPSTEMSEEPLEQYRRAVAGVDHVWCDNYAKIFIRVASCFGIPARRIEMLGKTLPSSGVTLLSTDGHATTEYFDVERNRWVWVDLTAGILGAYRANGLPLDVAGFHRLLTDPDGDPITVDAYVSSTNEQVLLTLNPADSRLGLRRFFNTDQRYVFLRSVRAPR